MSEKYAWEGKGLDEHAAKELYLWIENDSVLYDRQYTPIIKNLVAKKARGVYDHTLAAKLFGYLAESGAKRYDEEVEGAAKNKGRIPSYFPKKVRDVVAEELRDHFEAEYDLHNYDQYIPKKYQKKVSYLVGTKKTTNHRKVATGLGGVR